MNTQTTHPNATQGNLDDVAYARYLDRLRTRFREHRGPVFQTDIAPEVLWAEYLAAFATPQDRQFHTCHTCRRFIERFGGLVTVSPEGTLHSALWFPEDAEDPALREAITILAAKVTRSRIIHPFASSEPEFGVGVTGQWRHLSVPNPRILTGYRSAEEAMGVKRTEFEVVSKALVEYRLQTVEAVVRLLESGTLARSEKVLGQATWFRDLVRASSDTRNASVRRNLIWRAVAEAPSGFCHVRASVLATLLDDLESGADTNGAMERFARKMDPLQYQRTTAEITAGQVAVAERRIAELGLARSLERRFARLDEIPSLWTPAQPETPPSSGVFGHLLKAPAKVDISGAAAPPMSCEKFLRTVLPTAEGVEYQVLPVDRFCAWTTAVHPDAPTLFQWSNPVSHYFYARGSRATDFGLVAGSWVPVDAICYAPWLWDNHEPSHMPKGVLFALRGARDMQKPTTPIFPEQLRSDLREVRAVLEAHGKSRPIADAGGPYATGIMPQSGHPWSPPIRLRVLSRGVTSTYQLDRWD